MATLNKQDIEFLKGESKTYRLEITDANGDPVDLTGARIKMTVVDAANTASVLFTKDSDNGVAEVDIYDLTGGKAYVYVQPSDTSAAGSDHYRYDMWVELASGSRYAVISPSDFYLIETFTTFI